MLADLERRLAQVLGQRLPAPFTGRVAVAPDGPAGAGPEIRLAIGEVARREPDLGAFRSEVAPGVAQRRRVARLSCEIALTVTPQPAAGRAQRVAAVDALLYLLDDPEFRSARALAQPGDPGFLLSTLGLAGAHLSPDSLAEPPPDVLLSAEGWFWPIGEVGEDGPAIAEAQLRQLVLPVDMRPIAARIIAGSPAVALRFELGAAGTMILRDGSVASDDFERIAVSLEGPDGGAGAGSLSGGMPAAGGFRLVRVENDAASVTYQPPGAAAVDRVVLRSVTRTLGDTHFGPTLAVFELTVEAAP
jgi:hypothetical protein